MSNKFFSLVGRSALVTGGASGIGAATAGLICELGAKVALADINADGLMGAKERTGASNSFVGDVSVEVEAEEIVAAASDALGGLDTVVNAAGIVDEVKLAIERDIEPWQKILDVNLRGTFQVCRAAARIMVPQKGGSIVNIASVNGPG